MTIFSTRVEKKDKTRNKIQETASLYENIKPVKTFYIPLIKVLTPL